MNVMQRDALALAKKHAGAMAKPWTPIPPCPVKTRHEWGEADSHSVKCCIHCGTEFPSSPILRAMPPSAGEVTHE